jgi:hypothetical protein
MAIANILAAAAMFRWDKALKPGAAGCSGGRDVAGGRCDGGNAWPHRRAEAQDIREVGPATNYVAVLSARPKSWRDVTDRHRYVAFDRLPPDSGIISPVSA